MDEFEQFLSAQPLRSPPAAWQRTILLAHPAPRWPEWLWPSPVAWATVAGVWVMIIGLNLAARPKIPVTVQYQPAPNTVALAEQRRLLTELTSTELPPRPSPHKPGTRSELIFDPERNRYA
jgi:hypothetical protein